jgi:superfamily I DNA/RNA helicase
MNIYSEKMYHSRLAKLCLERKIDLIKQRLEKYFDYLYVDEVQDFAANDFNFILGLYNTNINILMVGDFYQHTFDTSRDGNTNSNLYNNYNNYLKRFTNANKSIVVDTTSLTKSKRCPKNVCDFVRENLKIHIESDIPNSIISEITKEEEIDKIICDNSIVKLFYSNSKKFLCNGDNWGNSKGKTYANVCVVLNKKSYELYIDNKLHESAQATLNKLYVACTRTKNNLYFIEEAKLVKYKKLEE